MEFKVKIKRSSFVSFIFVMSSGNNQCKISQTIGLQKVKSWGFITLATR